MARQWEESRTSPPKIAGGVRRKEAVGNVDPHDKEGTQEEKADQRTTPKAFLGSDQKNQEMEALAGRGFLHKGGMVVVSDRAKKLTLTNLLGIDATVIVMPQEQRVKIVRQYTNKGRHQKTSRGGRWGKTARATRWCSNEEQQERKAGKLPQGEGSPGSQSR